MLSFSHLCYNVSFTGVQDSLWFTNMNLKFLEQSRPHSRCSMNSFLHKQFCNNKMYRVFTATLVVAKILTSHASISVLSIKNLPGSPLSTNFLAGGERAPHLCSVVLSWPWLPLPLYAKPVHQAKIKTTSFSPCVSAPGFHSPFE